MTKYWLVLITMATGFVLAGCGDSDFGESDPGQAQVEKAQQYDADAAQGWDGVHVPKGTKQQSDLMRGQKGTEGSQKVDFKVVLTGPGSIRINYQDAAANLRRATLCADESCPANSLDTTALKDFKGQYEAPPQTGPIVVGGTWTFEYESAGRVWGVILCTIPEEETVESVGVQMSMFIDGNVTQYLEETVTRESPRELNLQGAAF